MSKILIIAEHLNGQLNPSTAKCVSCAAKIAGASIDVVVLAADPAPIAAQAAQIAGVARVRTIANAANAHALAAVYAPQVAAIAGDYTHVFGPSTTFGKDLMPRIAARLGVSQLSDVMAVDDAHTFKRPIYAGNAIVTVKAPAGQTVVATVRTASFPAAAGGGTCQGTPAVTTTGGGCTTQPTGTALMNGTSVAAVVVANSGKGCTAAPTSVNFTLNCSVVPTATATLGGGKITAVNLSTGGTCTSNSIPAVSITGLSGCTTQPVLQAVMTGTGVSQLVILDQGAGCSGTPAPTSASANNRLKTASRARRGLSASTMKYRPPPGNCRP